MLRIMCETITGDYVECFRWHGDAKSGIARAWADSKMFDIAIKRIWAE